MKDMQACFLLLLSAHLFSTPITPKSKEKLLLEYKEREKKELAIHNLLANSSLDIKEYINFDVKKYGGRPLYGLLWKMQRVEQQDGCKESVDRLYQQFIMLLNLGVDANYDCYNSTPLGQVIEWQFSYLQEGGDPSILTKMVIKNLIKHGAQPEKMALREREWFKNKQLAKKYKDCLSSVNREYMRYKNWKKIKILHVGHKKESSKSCNLARLPNDLIGEISFWILKN